LFNSDVFPVTKPCSQFGLLGFQHRFIFFQFGLVHGPSPIPRESVLFYASPCRGSLRTNYRRSFDAKVSQILTYCTGDSNSYFASPLLYRPGPLFPSRYQVPLARYFSQAIALPTATLSHHGPNGTIAFC